MECWNDGIMEKNGKMEQREDRGEMIERKNINRGFKKLRVWQDSVSLYILTCEIFIKFPSVIRRTASQAIDAAHSINRNIAEGYCRRSIKEYLNHLNIALGSCGEFYSCYESFRQAGQITDNQYEELDKIHYKVENSLISLIKSLQRKLKNGDWEETFKLD
jgi:four helix bundle protein